jgi:hypothetical protein
VSTSAIIALARPGGGWDGTFVYQDGGPGELGVTLLDLLVDHRGDLEAVWAFIARSPGYRQAFSEPYSPGELDWLGTGREGAALLRDTDDLSATCAGIVYVLDPRERTLTFLVPDPLSEELRWTAAERAVIDRRGIARFDRAPSDPLDYRNRVQDYGADAPEGTATRLLQILEQRLYIAGAWMLLCRCTKTLDLSGGEPVAVDAPEPSLTSRGLVCPMVLFVPQQRVDGEWDPWPEIAEIVEDCDLLLFPRRALASARRCEIALEAALGAIEEAAGAGLLPLDRSAAVFRGALFPFGYLDMDMNDSFLAGAVREHVLASICETEP